MHNGIDDAVKDDRLEKFDKAIEAMTDLARAMSDFEETSKEMKEVIGDLAVSKKIYKES